MVVTLNDSALHAAVSFDPRTGKSHYVQPHSLRASLQALMSRGVPRPLVWAAVAAGVWLGWQGVQWTLQNARSRRLRRAARDCDDLEELAALLYSIAPVHLGGFLTNATVQAVERASTEVGTEAHGRVLLFASGGWRYTRHSLGALPLDMSYPADGSRDERALFWLAVSLGKGTVLNGAMAFVLSMMMLQAEKEGREEGMQVRYRGRRIRNVGLCTGELYHNVAALQRGAEAASPAAPSVHPITRLDLVCEIGTLSAERVQQFQQMHWGQTPDPRSPQLADVTDFNTSAVLDYWRAHAALPDAQTPGFDSVLWEKRSVKPPAGKDTWLWIEVDAEGQDGAGGVERIHVDLGVHFAKGLSAGFLEDRAAEKKNGGAATADTAGAPVSAAAAAWSSLRGAFSALQLRLSSLLPASVSSALFAPSAAAAATPAPLFPFSSLPRPMLLPHRLVSDSRGVASRINESADGARDTIAMLQRLVLINSDAANTTHTQLRATLLDALQLCGLKNRWLVHRIPPARGAGASAASGDDVRPTTPPGGASSTNGKQGWPAPNIEQRGPKARQGRSARQRQQRRAKQRQSAGAAAGPDDSEDEEQAEERGDDDEDAIDVDTDSVRREVDDVD